MITGLAHACFHTRDLDRVIRYYSDGLGLPVAFEFRRDDGTRFGLYLKAGRRTFIEFFLGDPKDGSEGAYRHICLEVDDLPATVAQLRARGIEISDPKLGTDQSWQAWSSDPDGNAIEFHQYTPESWQAPHFD